MIDNVTYKSETINLIVSDKKQLPENLFQGADSIMR